MLNLNRDARYEFRRQCEKCKSAEGEIYYFHYGRKISSSSRRDMGGNILTTTKYNVAGEKKVAACDKCITRHRLLTSIKYFLKAVTLAGFVLWSYTQIPHGVNEPYNFFQAVLSFALIIAVLLGIGMLMWVLKTIFSGKDTIGENLAIAMQKGELRGQGFDSFWNSEQFAKLR